MFIEDHNPTYHAKLVREKISRPNDFKQAGETYRSFEEWERDDLIKNLVNALKVCAPVVQEKMIQNFKNADPEYGQRVEDGLAQAKKEEHQDTIMYTIASMEESLLNSIIMTHHGM